MSTIDSPGPALPTTWDRERSCVPFGRPSVSLIRKATAMRVAARAPVMSLPKEFQGSRGMQTTGGTGFLERAMGIEPTSEAWEASILPLYDARSTPKLSNGRISRKLALRHLLVAEATHQVVVHQTGGLHERVDNCRTDKPTAALL